MHRCFSARGYIGKARRRKEKQEKKTGRPKISVMSFTHSRFRGHSQLGYRDHFCYLCGDQSKHLCGRLCDRCNKWVLYHNDEEYHTKELERNRKYRETHRVENRERAKKYKIKKSG
jgi:hypothetical protein